MNTRIKTVGLGIAAAIAGYAVIAIITTLVFEVVLGGVSYSGSSTGTLAVASLGAVLAGLAGGSLAVTVGGGCSLAHAVYVLVPLTIDSVYVMTSGISSDPLWYDLAAAATLMLATVAGGWLVVRCCGSTPVATKRSLGSRATQADG